MAETGWTGGGERGEFRGDQWREKRVWGDRWELGYRDVEERERERIRIRIRIFIFFNRWCG